MVRCCPRLNVIVNQLLHIVKVYSSVHLETDEGVTNCLWIS